MAPTTTPAGRPRYFEVARNLASGPRPDHSVLFLAFTGEERGLWGSAQYVADPLLPLESTEAMLNMDMVGRVKEGQLTVFGVGTAAEWRDVLEESNPGTLNLQFVEDGYGSSDHSSFYGKGVPVLHFFSGTHPEYHRVADDWPLINEEGLDDVIALVSGVTRALAADSRVALTPIEGAGNPPRLRPTVNPFAPVSTFGSGRFPTTPRPKGECASPAYETTARPPRPDYVAETSWSVWATGKSRTSTGTCTPFKSISRAT